MAARAAQQIPSAEWERLQELEAIERESFNTVLANLKDGIGK